MLAAFPLLIIVIALANVILLFGGGDLNAAMFTLPLLSGASWTMSLGDLLVGFGLLLLYLEIFKSTRTTTGAIFDHLFSMILFVVALLQFLAMPAFANSTFFLLVLMCFIDVVAGFTVTISAARRDIGLDDRARL